MKINENIPTMMTSFGHSKSRTTMSTNRGIGIGLPMTFGIKSEIVIVDNVFEEGNDLENTNVVVLGCLGRRRENRRRDRANAIVANNEIGNLGNLRWKLEETGIV